MTTAKKTLNLLRCPRCHCSQKAPVDGWCRACGKASRSNTWETFTQLHPVQPEEADGGRCPHCDGVLDVRLPAAGPIAEVFWLWVLVGVVVGAIAILERASWWVAAGFFLPAAMLSPFSLLFHRYRGPDVLRSIVVTCRGCGHVRIAGQTAGELVGAFRRGGAAFNTIYRRLLPLFAFLVVMVIGARFTETPLDPLTPVLLMASGFFLTSVRWYRGVFGFRSWW